jgi:ribonuclease-3
VLAEFCRHYQLPFKDLGLLKLALTHRSYLSVTGQGPRESNERLEFLGDSVLGLVTSEALYRRHPDEHEGQLTKTKSLLVSKAILSRRALRMGLGRFVLMSHSEVESGGRQRLSILADAFESVIGAVYLDQGFETSRKFIHEHLLADSDAITSDKRHTNYKSHLQEYVQNAFRTHPVYRIRSEFGPDHSKHFVVEVMVGKRSLGEGRGHNKKEAEQAAARDALEKVEKLRRKVREDDDREAGAVEDESTSVMSRSAGGRDEREFSEREPESRSTRSTRGGRDGRRGRAAEARHAVAPAPAPEPAREARAPEPVARDDDEDRDESAGAGARRRRSRRGGRRRHGRGEEVRDTAPPAAREPQLEDPRATEPAYEQSGEPASSHGHNHAPSPGLEWDEPEPEVVPDWTPAAPAAAEAPAASPAEPAAARSVSFGRGRRRGAAPAPAPAAAEPVPGPVDTDAERLLDPYDTSEPRAKAEVVPVVDVQPPVEVVGEETERERDARIDEMERALENFGRRRSPDAVRRGRRR